MIQLVLLLAAGLEGAVQDAVRDAATAKQLARSVDLYAPYTGRWPRTLEDLILKPEHVRFWPEGGFWFGELPKEKTTKR